jgi:hypothetical protein
MEEKMENYLLMLKHDLHKLSKNAPKHKNALTDKVMQKADGIASWLSRNFRFQEFSNKPFRISLVKNSNGNNNYREYKIHKTESANNLFTENDPIRLHEKILNSELLNLYNEAITYPYTSLKYHLLLSCSIYYNLFQGHDIFNLYLCENDQVDSPFQIIFKNDEIEWVLTPHKGISRVWHRFDLTWMRRITDSIGGDRVLDGLLSSITSWSTALATIEDYNKENK